MQNKTSMYVIHIVMSRQQSLSYVDRSLPAPISSVVLSAVLSPPPRVAAAEWRLSLPHHQSLLTMRSENMNCGGGATRDICSAAQPDLAVRSAWERGFSTIRPEPSGPRAKTRQPGCHAPRVLNVSADLASPSLLSQLTAVQCQCWACHGREGSVRRDRLGGDQREYRPRTGRDKMSQELLWSIRRKESGEIILFKYLNGFITTKKNKTKRQIFDKYVMIYGGVKPDTFCLQFDNLSLQYCNKHFVVNSSIQHHM